jgi:hypothetical protein
VCDSRGTAFAGAAVFAATLGLLDAAKAALAEDEFVPLGAGDEDVATSRLTPASLSGALDATFPVLVTVGRGVCDAGCGDAMAA